MLHIKPKYLVNEKTATGFREYTDKTSSGRLSSISDLNNL